MPKTKRFNFPLFRSMSARTKVLFFLGLFLLIVPTLFYINETIQLMYFVPAVPKITKVSTEAHSYPQPISIDIPAVHIHLPIEETSINNNVWSISPNGASHLVDSANPGQAGPIILYGHNTNNRFGPIRWLTRGKTIAVTTADNEVHTYTIVETKIVNPDQMSIFFSRKKETLYLYTCDGFADLKRFIIAAEPKIASSSGSLQ